MATLHLMVGLPCSGKTTYARYLEKEHNALLLTPDVWHLKLFGDDAQEEAHDARHSIVESIMWDIAKRALLLGCNVILDFGFWAREERDDFHLKANEIGAKFEMHYMDVPMDELYRRLDERNKCQPRGVFVIPKQEMDKYIKIFEPPTPDEFIDTRYA